MYPSIVRTAVPYLVGVIVTALTLAATRAGITLPETALTDVVTPIVSAAAALTYYTAARLLERHTSPRVRRIGRLLLTAGLTRQEPAYVGASSLIDQAAARRTRTTDQ